MSNIGTHVMVQVVTKYGKYSLHQVVPASCSFSNAKILITPNLSSSVKTSKLELLSAGLLAVLGKDVRGTQRRCSAKKVLRSAHSAGRESFNC